MANQFRNKWLIAVLFLVVFTSSAFSAEAPPEHFQNPPENINPDPNFVPGSYPIPDTYAARSAYELKRSELVGSALNGEAERIYSIGNGEIQFSSVKNETANVIGSFRNFSAVGMIGEEGPKQLDLIVDLNSIDTGVPGRDRRIQSLFFQSIKPELGTVSVIFDRINLGGLLRSALEDGTTHQILAQGTLLLNGVSQMVSASLNVTKKSGTWTVETISPVSVLISDFSLGERAYELMKACNHKSIGNAVSVTVKLYLR